HFSLTQRMPRTGQTEQNSALSNLHHIKKGAEAPFILVAIGSALANIHQQLFHPLMAFIAASRFMPREIAGPAVNLQRQ
ncbi:hypothetical protein WAJ14_22130, partial [Acinetobacter baumannii]